MPVDAATWHEIYRGFEQVLGAERAAAVMSVLPNVDWAQIVLRPHLEATEHRLRAHTERTVREAVTTQTRWFVGSVATLTVAMIGSNIALISALR